jgi:hypothetical protein
VNDYRTSLKVAGIALIAVGILDIGWMIYCIVHARSYSSSFNIFAVIAGILLIRGGLRTANIAAFFSALMLSACLGIFLVFPLLMPWDLVLTHLRLYPYPLLRNFVLTISILAFLVWLYRRLTQPSVMVAIAERYPRWTSGWRRPRTGFFVGIILVAILATALSFVMHSTTADRAIAEAKQKVGEGYKFHVTHLNMISSRGTTRVGALVTAYNDKEIKTVAVTWEQ